MQRGDQERRARRRPKNDFEKIARDFHVGDKFLISITLETARQHSARSGDRIGRTQNMLAILKDKYGLTDTLEVEVTDVYDDGFVDITFPVWEVDTFTLNFPGELLLTAGSKVYSWI